jgi:hypothetical protein
VLFTTRGLATDSETLLLTDGYSVVIPLNEILRSDVYNNM